MNLSVTLTHDTEAGRWRATEHGTGVVVSARRPDTALGRLVIVLMYQGHIDCGPNLRDVFDRIGAQALEGGAA